MSPPIKFLFMSLKQFNILHKMADEFMGVAEDIQLENAQVLVTAIKDELSQKGTGKYYNWSRNRKQYTSFTRKSGQTVSFMARRKHRASAPGQPPAVWTNAYRSSWEIKGYRNGMSVFAEVTNPLWSVYGHRLEYGGRSTNKATGVSVYIEPRPHIRPAIRKAREFISYRNSVWARAEQMRIEDRMAKYRAQGG